MKREKIRLPKIKGKFRLLLYLVALVFCALSVAETMFGYFSFAIEIVIYVIAAVTLTVTCFYLAGDLKRGIRELRLQELRVYRNTGILLSFITIALAGAVILLVNQEGGKSYQGYMIFVVAMYTFYKAIISIINIMRARKMQSPLLIAIRDIGYADALVSVLSLQTAMFSSFGEESDIDPTLMNGITGVCVCIMTLAIGIYMICSAGRQRKRIQEEMQEGL